MEATISYLKVFGTYCISISSKLLPVHPNRLALCRLIARPSHRSPKETQLILKHELQNLAYFIASIIEFSCVIPYLQAQTEVLPRLTE